MATTLAALAVLLHPFGAVGPAFAQDPSNGADEMILQADRLLAAHHPCQAASRYRAVVGARPEVFVRYAEARAACLAGQAGGAGRDEGSGAGPPAP
jgi:hypothetical protein